MKARFHGVFSLVLVSLSAIVALMALMTESISMGMLYLVILCVSPLIILYAFCAKCLCREHACSHVFPGRLTRFLPERTQTDYTFSDIFWTAIPLMALFIFPQFWMWQNKLLFILFWVLFLAGLLEILLLVCRGCGNTKCPLCPGVHSIDNPLS